MDLRPAVSAIPGILLERQMCDLCPRLIESEALAIASDNLFFSKFFRDYDAHRSLRMSGPEYVLKIYWNVYGCLCVREIFVFIRKLIFEPNENFKDTRFS